MPGPKSARSSGGRAGRRPSATAAGPTSAQVRGGAEASVPRRVPNQSRARQTVAAILEAAGQLLVERGYTAASTNMIAARAGVSVGSLYQYFASKDAIYRALIEDHGRQVETIVQQGLEAIDRGTPGTVKILIDMIRALIVLHERHPPLIKAMDTQLGELVDDDGTRQFEAAVARTARVLERHPEYVGRDPEADAWLLATALSAVTRQLAHTRPAAIEPTAVIQSCERLLQAFFRMSS